MGGASKKHTQKKKGMALEGCVGIGEQLEDVLSVPREERWVAAGGRVSRFVAQQR